MSGPSIEQTWIPITQWYMYLVPSLVEISPAVLEKKIKMWEKVYNDKANTIDNDDRQQTHFHKKAHLKLLLWLAKKITKTQPNYSQCTNQWKAWADWLGNNRHSDLYITWTISQDFSFFILHNYVTRHMIRPYFQQH